MNAALSPRLRWRTGFTLIEVLMASAAAALILVAVYGVFGKAMKLRDDATERTRMGRLRIRAAAVIRNDLRNALISGGELATTLHGDRESTDSRFPGNLEFTTTTGRNLFGDGPAGDLQTVQYWVANDPVAGGVDAGILSRAVHRNLLAEVIDVPPAEPLLAGVTALEVAFYNGQSWEESWEVTDTEKTLPQAIRVRIVQAGAAGTAPPPPIEIYVPWLTEAATLSTQTTVSAGPPGPGVAGGAGGGGTPP